MSYKVLARKWRPAKFSELVGQQHITKTIQRSLEKQEVGHAYLFCGTRGVGKTTLARIFSKAIRCQNLGQDYEPCLECTSCTEIDASNSIDYVEIDGASNNSVEDIRSLIESVQYLPTSGPKKIYVIDEVHMLSVSAFNALLKTLEEPPAHVMFILATTNPEKIPGTVLSRCQRFDFRSAKPNDVSTLLKDIFEKEQITFESEYVIQELSRLGKGSFRDTLSLVEQVKCYTAENHITEGLLEEALGVAARNAIDSIVKAVIEGEPQKVSELFQKCLRSNVEINNLVYGLLDRFYEIVKTGSQEISSMDIEQAELFWVFENLSKDMNFALESFDPIKVSEIAALKVTQRRQFFNSPQKKTENLEVEASAPSHQESTASLLSEVEELKNDSEGENSTDFIPEEKSSEMPESAVSKDEVTEQQAEPIKQIIEEPIIEVPKGEKTWEGFMEYLFQKNKVLESNLAQGNLTGELGVVDGSLDLKIGFSQSAAVFTEVLKQRLDDLKLILSEYFSVEADQIRVELEVVKNEEDFKSRVDLEEEELQKANEMKEKGIKENPHILKAQKLFGSQIDKVILNK